MKKLLAISLKSIEELSRILTQLWHGKSSIAATIQTFIAQILIIAINIGTGIITARFLGATGRGELAALILWPQFLAYTLTLGLPTASIYNLKSHPEQKSELFTAILLLGTGLGLVSTLVGIIFLPSWLSQYSATVITTAQIFMLFAPSMLLTPIFRSALEAEDEFMVANQLRYLSPLLTLIALVILTSLQLLTPTTAGLSYLVPNLPLFLITLIYLWRRFHPRWTNLISACQQLLSYGLRSYGIDLLASLSSRLGQALVIGFLTPSALGIYTVALNASRMLDVLQSSIVIVLLPKATARPLTEVINLTSKVARISIFLSCFASLIAIILSPILLGVLYGSEFLDAVVVLRILLVEVPISGLTWILAQAFLALGKPGIITILQGIGLGLSFPMMLILIPQYGMIGAALALLFSTIARLVFICLSYPFILKVKPPNLLINQQDWHTLRDLLMQRK